jgi:hypothetical protein
MFTGRPRRFAADMTCAFEGATIKYACFQVLRALSSLPVRRLIRTSVIAVAVAIVLVPAVARARQRVEHRDATRLSIKHSWIGIAPPTKTVVAPRQIVVVPAIAIQPGPRQVLRLAAVAPPPALHPVLDLSPDPLRGPPSAFRS